MEVRDKQQALYPRSLSAAGENVPRDLEAMVDHKFLGASPQTFAGTSRNQQWRDAAQAPFPLFAHPNGCRSFSCGLSGTVNFTLWVP